jgi:1-acyl-sn-glycerol-3-phosphate acyltransferase
MKSIFRLFNMLHLFWGLISFFVFMILMMPFILLSYALLNGKKATDVVFVFLNIWACGVNLLMGYRYQVLGKHLVKKNQAYIFVVNHSSYLDSLAVVRVIPQSFKPLGKVEMVKIPIFGMIYKKLVVLIDRSSRESREKCVKDLKVEIARGQSILIFPEGTMNKTDQLLGAFYDGAFRIAIETQTPIMPLTIINTKELMPRNNPKAIKSGLVHCVFSEAIPVQGLKTEDISKLKNQVYSQMEAELLKYKSINQSTPLIA